MLYIRLTLPPRDAAQTRREILSLSKQLHSEPGETRLVEFVERETYLGAYAELNVTYVKSGYLTRRYESLLRLSDTQVKFVSAGWYGFERPLVYRADSGPLSVNNGARTSSIFKTMAEYEVFLLRERVHGIAKVELIPNNPA